MDTGPKLGGILDFTYSLITLEESLREKMSGSGLYRTHFTYSPSSYQLIQLTSSSIFPPLSPDGFMT